VISRQTFCFCLEEENTRPKTEATGCCRGKRGSDAGRWKPRSREVGYGRNIVEDMVTKSRIINPKIFPCADKRNGILERRYFNGRKKGMPCRNDPCVAVFDFVSTCTESPISVTSSTQRCNDGKGKTVKNDRVAGS
jgi:hypothetical protein